MITHETLRKAEKLALESLAAKIEAQGRVIAPGASVQWKWTSANTLEASVDTIPKEEES